MPARSLLHSGSAKIVNVSERSDVFGALAKLRPHLTFQRSPGMQQPGNGPKGLPYRLRGLYWMYRCLST
jgi:hypothetical protein